MDISAFKSVYNELGQLYSDAQVLNALTKARIATPRKVWVPASNPEDEERYSIAIGLYTAHILLIEEQQLGVAANLGANLAADRAVSPLMSGSEDHLLSTSYGQQYRSMRSAIPCTGIAGLY
jgi:hypothetical protein